VLKEQKRTKSEHLCVILRATNTKTRSADSGCTLYVLYTFFLFYYSFSQNGKLKKVIFFSSFAKKKDVKIDR